MKDVFILSSISDDDLKKIVDKRLSFASVIKDLGLSHRGTVNYHRLRSRLDESGIDYSHIINAKSSGSGPHQIFCKRKSDSEVFCKDSKYNRGNLKRRILVGKLLPYKCSVCGASPEWLGKPLVLVLDHINGEYNDNRIKNLRFLCPNCNSQQPTFCGKHKKKTYSCKECGSSITKYSKLSLCRACVAKRRSRKVPNRPSSEDLERMISESSYTAVGREYGVSGNAVKKWAKSYGIV